MGRNIKPESQEIVPINGSVYRNSSGRGLIYDSTGAQYFPSSSYGLFSISDYKEFVDLNSKSSSVLGVSAGSGAVNNGVLATANTSLGVTNYHPYIQSYPYAYTPFKGQTGKYRFTGSSVTAGSNVICVHAQVGYRQSTGNDNPAYIFNTSGVYQQKVTSRALIAWFDSGTSTYRILGANDSYNTTIYTSSDGITWSSAVSSISGANTFNWTYVSSSGSYKTAQLASGQKVFAIINSSVDPGSFALYASTNGGTSFTDRSTAVTGNANAFFSLPETNGNVVSMCYDGTTLFVPIASSVWRYSTNDGTSFSTTTISGVTSSSDNYPVGAIQGGNASTWMYIYSNQVSSARIFVTTNGGQSFTTYNWTPAESLQGSYTVIVGDYDSANNKWCFVYQTASNKLYSATSTDNGATWTHSLVHSLGISQAVFCAYLDDAFYVGSDQGIFRSTNGTTWTTLLSTSPGFFSYGQPYYSLTDYVSIGSYVIRKSDQSIARLNNSALINNASGYNKNFGNYITSNLFVYGQPGTNFNYQLVSSSNAFSANLYTNYTFGSQQTTNNPSTIEYWRIK